jgi:hypothetical protein
MLLDTASVSGGSGNFTYDWEISPSGINSWTNAPGIQNEATYNVATDIPGTYYFRQKLDDTGRGCLDNILSNVLTVIVNGPSAIYDISGGGNYCSGTTPSITMNNSKLGENYELYIESNQFAGFFPSGIVQVGTGGPLTFSGLKLGGNYKVVAPREVNGCSATMNGLAMVTPDFTLQAAASPAAAVCGEEITVVVTAPCAGPALIGMQFSVAWDALSYDYVPGSAVGKVLPGAFINNSASGYLQYSWSSNDVSYDVPAFDTLLIFKLKAISKDGTGNIELVNYMPGDLEALQEHFHMLLINTMPPVTVALSEPGGSITANAPLVCKGTDNVTLTFHADAGNPPFSLVINGNTYNNLTDGGTITLTANANTTYNLTSVSDVNGCVTQGSPNLSSVTVQVNEKPTVSIDALGEYQLGVTLQHGASVSPSAPANGAYTYLWKACPNAVCNSCTASGFLPDSSSANPSRQWTHPGANAASLLVSTPGCSDVQDCEDFNLLFDVGPYGVPGGRELPNNFSHPLGPAPWKVTYGPSTRRVIDLSQPGQAVGGNPTGQSGVLFDRHYKDQAEGFHQGRYMPQHLLEASVQAHTRSTLTLKPER